MPQALEEGKSSYRGRSWKLGDNYAKKSAEVIVIVENKLWIDPTEVSQNNEGLNIKSSEIRQGGSNFKFASLISNYDKDIVGVKSDVLYLMNRCIRDPYVQWRERGSPC